MPEKKGQGECIPPLIAGKGELLTADMEKAEVLSNFFASVFTASQAPHFSQVPEPVGSVWGSRVPPTVSKEQVQDHLLKLNSYKHTEPNDMHPRVLRELADAVAMPPSMIFEKLWQTVEAPGDWKKSDSHHSHFKKGRKEDLGN